MNKSDGAGTVQTGDLFFAAIALTRIAMVVTDPELPENPIVYANTAFEELFGYPVGEILGRNPRFMQSGGSDPAVLDRIKSALAARNPISIEIENQRADGARILNALSISPIFDADGQLIYFLGSQQEASGARRLAQAERELAQVRTLLEHSLQAQRSARSLVQRAYDLLGAPAARAEADLSATLGDARNSLSQALDALPQPPAAP